MLDWVYNFLNKNKLVVILLIFTAWISGILSIKDYFFNSKSTILLPDKAVNINDSRGIIFKDSIIEGGTSVSNSEEVGFERTRIKEQQ